MECVVLGRRFSGAGVVVDNDKLSLARCSRSLTCTPGAAPGGWGRGWRGQGNREQLAAQLSFTTNEFGYFCIGYVPELLLGVGAGWVRYNSTKEHRIEAFVGSSSSTSSNPYQQDAYSRMPISSCCSTVIIGAPFRRWVLFSCLSAKVCTLM